MLQSFKSALLPVLFLALSSCGAFNFHGQDLALRHDVEQDTMELELIYKSVETPKSISAPRGSKTTGQAYTLEMIQEIAQGKRYFMLGMYGFAFDIDQFELALKEDNSIARKLTGPLLTICEGLSVLEAQVFVDSSHHLGIRQKLQLTGAKQALKTLNMGWHGDVIRESENGNYKRDTADIFDDATRAAMLKEAISGVQWVQWSGSDLIVSLPLNTSSTANLLHAVLEEQEKTDDREVRAVLSGLFGLMCKLSTDGGRLTMTFGADDTGIIRMELASGSAEYKDALLKKLQEQNFKFDPAPTTR